MTANASILVAMRENVLAVPTAAIRQGGFGAQSGQAAEGSFVLVIQDGQTRRVSVSVGITAGDLTEVSGDLNEGDLVVVGTATSSRSSTGDFPGGPGFFDGGAPPDGGGGPPDGGAPPAGAP
jgi:multidrug efflux pump subunit AcrA (membrane-fusion protein)